MDPEIADVRAFNRFYTRIIGALDGGHLATKFSLPEARLIYEVAMRQVARAADVARAMGVDPAYVSRLVNRLKDEGVLVLTPNDRDKRQTDIALSAKGRKAFAKLDAATNDKFAALLSTLDPLRRQALVGAMTSLRSLLGDDTERGPVVLRPQRLGEIGLLIHRQGLLYNQQYGWNGDFEALIARIYNEYYFAPGSPPKALWVAEQNGRIAGSIFAMPTDNMPGSAQLRMLYVEPEARGQGIGRMLVDHCVSFARDAGYERMRLWTHSIQVEARRLYAGAGFSIVESEPHKSFGKALISEIWELRF
jgi:GNAT superfamily N-acetyltransferase/DNA-binding MarR family transcriptional regulator